MLGRACRQQDCFPSLGALRQKTFKNKCYAACDRSRQELNCRKQNQVLEQLGFKRNAEIVFRDGSTLNRVRDDVTLAAVVGSASTESFKKHVQAIMYSSRGLKFKETILFAPANPKHKYSDAYSWIKINPMNFQGYNEFCIKELHKHVKTGHLLLIQDDGYVLHPECWTDEFFNYDYIGSPSPFKIGLRDELVFNGGFSLRSKKFLELCSDFSDYQATHLGEDRFIFKHRKYFEERGVKFPSLLIGAAFSHAYDSDFSLVKAFGFHGRTNYEAVALKDAIEVDI